MLETGRGGDVFGTGTSGLSDGHLHGLTAVYVDVYGACTCTERINDRLRGRLRGRVRARDFERTCTGTLTFTFYVDGNGV